MTTVNILNLNKYQASWLLAKHLWPKDLLVQRPELAKGDAGYDLIDNSEGDSVELVILAAIHKYKLTVAWRPWFGECGQWWACAEDDPFDEETLGIFHDSREWAIVLALVAHLEEAKITMKVDLPEVLL